MRVLLVESVVRNEKMSSPHMQTLLAIVAVLLVVTGLLIRVRGGLRRAAALRAWASTAGFTYGALDREAIRERFTGCPLMARGRAEAVRHVLHREEQGHDTFVFDWLNTSGWDRGGEVRTQTCVGFVAHERFGLPAFALYAGRPGSVHLAQAGWSTVPLPEDFSRRRSYWLQAPTPDAMQDVVSPALGRQLDRLGPLHIECSGSAVLICGPNVACPAQRVPEFVAQSESLLAVMLNNAPANS